MKFIHLSSEKEYCGTDVIVEVQLIQSLKIYKYRTSSYIEEKFLIRAKKDKNSWRSFNYLKKNSKEEKWKDYNPINKETTLEELIKILAESGENKYILVGNKIIKPDLSEILKKDQSIYKIVYLAELVTREGALVDSE